MLVTRNNLHKISSFFLFLGLFLTIFGFEEVSGSLYQTISLLCILTSGVFCFFLVGGLKYISRIEVAFIFSIITSLVTSLVYNNLYSIQYTFGFGLFCFSAAFIARAYSLYSLTKLFAHTSLVIIAVILILEFPHWRESISYTMTPTGLVRFRPLGMHPNLTGIVYSGTSIVLFFISFKQELFKFRMIYLGFCLISFSFALAASARGSLIMLFIAFCFWLIHFISVKGYKIFWHFLLAAILIIYSILNNFSVLYDYFAGILEIESSYRGVDTGGTGRTELWILGMNGLYEDPLRLLFGGGFRSAEESNIGFSLESSYLVLIYEVGIFNALHLIFLIALTARINFIYSDEKLNNAFSLNSMAFYISIFFLMQSFFNRYLISIGSFFTIYFILMVFVISVSKKFSFKII